MDHQDPKIDIKKMV